MLPCYSSSEGSFRLEVDTSSYTDGMTFGVGGIIRDNTGLLLGVAYWPELKLSSIGQAELEAIQLGLHLAAESGVRDLNVFSNAYEVSKV